MSKPTLRFAKPTDMHAVLDLVNELALYEKAPQEVTVTVNELVEDGFTHKLFTCIVAELAGEIVGMAFYYPRYSTWKGRTIHLEDFIVKEAFRGCGIGQMLFDKVVEESKKFGAKRLEWHVLDWNEPAINFYKKIDAHLDDEWMLGKLTEEQILEYLDVRRR